MYRKSIPRILQDIVEFFPHTLCVCVLSGKKGNIEGYNKRFEMFFDSIESQLLGSSLVHLLTQMGAKHAGFILQNPADGEARTFTLSKRTFISFKKTLRNGDLGLEIDDVLYLFFWGEIPYQHGEKYELLLHEFEIILDSIHDGVWIIDGNGITLHANKALKRIAGISAKDVVGKHVTIPMQEGKFATCVTLDALEQKKTVTQFDDYLNGKRCLNTSSPILTDNGDVHRVVASIRDMTELESLQDKVAQIELEASRYKGELEKLEKGSVFVGNSTVFQKSLKQLKKVAKSTSSVLLMGETGTGKSLAASYIHDNSDRKDKPLIAINCAAIAESLIDSELFGYQKGAFTGADQGGKKGYFELADGGTLLLDEIGELPLGVQAKLLHVLDNYSFHKVGGNASVHVDVRIIAATNRSLDELVKTGEFRKDLYYRLHVLTVTIPPLRERCEDVPLLANAFLGDACRRLGTAKSFHKKALLALSGYNWPGNVRELRGAVEYLVAMSEGSIIKAEDMSPYIFAENLEENTSISIKTKNLVEAVSELERGMIKDALIQEGSTYKAAKKLGISQSSVVRKAKSLGIRISE